MDEDTDPRPTNDPDTGPRPANEAFPIVGIGASAGGLDAFTEILRTLPPDTGMAFVMIQHLDPTHASMLWSRNLTNFVLNFWKDKERTFNMDLGDEILRGATITHKGEIVHENVKKAVQAAR